MTLMRRKRILLFVLVLMALLVIAVFRFPGYLVSEEDSAITTLVKAKASNIEWGPLSGNRSKEQNNREPAFFTNVEPILYTAGRPDIIPELEVPIVHYLWCQKQFFRFENLLSLISVVKTVRPMKIIFHYTSLPGVDGLGYYTWFNEIKRTVPNFVLHHLGDNHECKKGPTEKLKTAWEYVSKNGGMYVGERTIFKTCSASFRKNALAYSLSNTDSTAGVIYKNRNLKPNSDQDFMARKRSHLGMRCCALGEFEKGEPSCLCVIVQNILYPKDIWTLPTSFGKLARWLTYGQVEKLEPKPDFTELAARISHYLWFGKREFNYAHYLSVLSSLYVAGMRRVYFHGDIEPTGPIWQKLITEEKNVTFLVTDPPESVYNQKVKVPAHWGDIAKVYALLKYGGISQDPDIFWVNFVPDELLAHDSVAAFDWPYHDEWPDTFNIGVLIAKKNSKYIRELLLSFRDYQDSSWGHNAIDVPYRVYEKTPSKLFVNPHLQVLCYNGKCHPTWLPNFKERHGQDRDHPFDWKTETLSVHVIAPKPPNEFKSLEVLKKSSGKIAEFGINILKKAGRWKGK